MTFYEPFQNLQFAYIKTKEQLLIYLRSSFSVYLKQGESLMGALSVKEDRSWVIDYYMTSNSNIASDYLFEKIELILISNGKPPVTDDPRLIVSAVKTAIEKLIPLPDIYSVTCNIYNAKKEKTGQVTTTINKEGGIVVV